ncbi:MAG: hypothetical protein Q8J68_08805 [Methanolobus sp.]|uniref:hypothetical protein n=1 Tax=Methanolobus sp. TaxID=1874737 RepID=UPI002731CC8C|nr:hypothetical protein [Methanolobus sp.]MDP2217371.1 hypothetical protein [Methanolobus sp.]
MQAGNLYRNVMTDEDHKNLLSNFVSTSQAQLSASRCDRRQYSTRLILNMEGGLGRPRA